MHALTSGRGSRCKRARGVHDDRDIAKHADERILVVDGHRSPFASQRSREVLESVRRTAGDNDVEAAITRALAIAVRYDLRRRR